MILNGKTALITGGSEGIGAAIVRRFAKEGANVWFGDINQTAGEDLVKELSLYRSRLNFITLDVT